MLFRYKLLDLWETTRNSYWFVPATLAAGAVALAIVLLRIDARDDQQDGWLSSLVNVGPDGARQLLSAVAASMITVAGTVFSITIVILVLASQQFGPRLLRNFMADRATQFTLGVFTATFLYCLVVLLTIHGDGDGGFVPRRSTAAAMLMVMLSVGVLIYFIHHIALRLQASSVVAAVWSELCQTTDRLFPEHIGHDLRSGTDEPARSLPHDFERTARAVFAPGIGYIRRVDDRSLMHLADRHDLVIRLLHRPGDFVDADPVALAWPAERVSDRLCRQIRRLFIVGVDRTPTQDIEFAFDQLVEIASRALSPSLNDPFTAQICLDHIAAGLARLAPRPEPSPCRYNARGRLRVVAEPARFVDLVHRTFEPIRQYGASHALVTSRLLDTLALIAPHARTPEDRAALIDEARRVRASSRSERPDDPQQAHLDRKCNAVLRALEDGRSPLTAAPADAAEVEAATTDLG